MRSGDSSSATSSWSCWYRSLLARVTCVLRSSSRSCARISTVWNAASGEQRHEQRNAPRRSCRHGPAACDARGGVSTTAAPGDAASARASAGRELRARGSCGEHHDRPSGAVGSGASRPRGGGRSRRGGLRATSAADGFHAPRLSRRTVGTAPHTHGRPGGQVQPPVAASRNAPSRCGPRPSGRRARRSGRRARARRWPASSGAGQDVELVVDLDAQRLERALGRVAAACGGPAAGMASRTISASSPVVRDRAGGDDGPGDAAGEALVAVAARAPRRARPRRSSLTTSAAVRRCVRSMRMSSGRVVAVAEAALGPVELGRADAEVEQHAADVGRSASARA